MAFSKLTKFGEQYIHKICDDTGTKLLSGNNGPMPYTYPIINKNWTSHALYPPANQKEITNGIELANALIYWYNYYCKIYGLDANVIAAQGITESNYNIWIYAGFAKAGGQPIANQSTASGLNQFLSTTMFDVVVNKHGQHYNEQNPFTATEIAKMTKNLIGDINVVDTYKVGGYVTGQPPSQYQIGWTNRPIYHQNVIDNPGIMIKAQCVYMKYIADLCSSLTSSTIISYGWGSSYARKTYPDTVAAIQRGAGAKAATDGVNYVLKIFGILGDKFNLLGAQGKIQPKNYKIKGEYFGYDDFMNDKDISKNLKLFEPYNSFETTLG